MVETDQQNRGYLLSKQRITVIVLEKCVSGDTNVSPNKEIGSELQSHRNTRGCQRYLS